LFLLGKPKS